MGKGWILLHRKFFDNALWKEKRELSKAEAWIDLIQQARWKDTETSLLHNGQIVRWGRGQLVASIRFLRTRWNWKSNTKVKSFLELLEKEDAIRYENKTPIGRITICNYDSYQDPKDVFKDTDKTQKGQAKDKTEKKDKESKESKYAFDEFWDLYDKKKDRKKCEKKWDRITESEKGKIMDFIPVYHKSEPDEKYRKYPYTFLNSEIWNDDWDSYRKNGKDESRKAVYYL